MKKLFILALALIMVLSLCACSKDSTKNTQPGNTTSGDTQATDTPTTPKDSTPETTVPSETSATQPAACSHSWKNATCDLPKTCTKCGATEGSALEHDFKDGSCTKCDAEDNRVPFSNNNWLMDAPNGTQLNRISLDPTNGTGMMSVSFWSENSTGEDIYQYDGKNYSTDGFGEEAELTYTEDGNTVQINVSANNGAKTGTMTLKRANATQYTVAAVTGTIISDSVTSAITVGSTFTVHILYID